jgi:hypothetical protein
MQYLLGAVCGAGVVEVGVQDVQQKSAGEHGAWLSISQKDEVE